MTSIKDTFGSSYGGGYSVTTANPTQAEIYLYDVIDDIRSWINKNKRNNITGRKIKPVMQGWLKELDKVYPHLADKNVSNGSKLQTTITNIKAAMQRVLGKSDSDLTFEYLAQYGNPDKSRQVFWGSFDTLFAGLSKDLNVDKKGSAYIKRGGSGPGVFGGMKPDDEKKNRWFGGSSILRGAGSNDEKVNLQNNQVSGPSSPLNKPTYSTSNTGSTSGSSTDTSTPTPSSHIPHDVDEEDEGVTAPVGDSMTKDQVRQIEDNETYSNAFTAICLDATAYLEKVIKVATVAYVKVIPLIKTAILESNGALQSSRKLVSNTDAILNSMDDDNISILVNTITDRVYTVNGKIDEQELRKVLKGIGYIDENKPFKVFGVNLNSNESIDNIRVPIRKDNNRRGGSNNYNKGDEEWSRVEEMCKTIRNLIFKNQKLSQNLKNGNKNPKDIILEASGRCVAVINDIKKNDDAYGIMKSFSNSSKDYDGMFNKVIDFHANLNDAAEKNDIEKLIDNITGTMGDINTSLPNPELIKKQYEFLQGVTRGRDYIDFSKSVEGDVTAGSLIEYIRKTLAKNEPNIKNIIDAYRSLTRDNGPRIKSFDLKIPIRRLVSREMIKMLHEMESYWD